MALNKTGAKINFYKFVDPDGGRSQGAAQTRSSRRNVNLTKTIKLQTTATNNLGATVNSLGTVIKDIRASQLSLLEAERERARQRFKPVFLKPQKIKKFGGFDSLFKGKLPGFLESLMNLIGAFLKFALVLPALDWLSNPENQDKVVTIIETLGKVFKFIAGWAKFSINNTINGLYELLADESTLRERIGGLFKALKGLGAAWLGISILTNPMAVVNAFKNVLIFLNKGLLAAAAKLATHPLVLAGLALTAGKYIPKFFPETVDREERNEEEQLIESGQSKEERIAELKQQKEDLTFMQKLFGKGKEIDELIYYLETGQTKSYGFANGGYLDGYAKGGWISGPQSGYPVSLDGNKPDFIGHGTEYVATKSDGSAFVVPFDTPATRAMPGLLSSRLAEASSMGFMSGGGALDSFTKRMIKEHEGLRLDKYSDKFGNPTIGYGHLVTPNSKIPNTISKAYANQLFEKDYRHHKRAAQSIPGYDKMSLQQKAAMIDLTFNMGPQWYQEFPLMMAAIQKGDYKTAGAELKNSLYYNQVGRRGPVTVALIQNKGLVGVGEYLLNKGITIPKDAESKKAGFFGGIFNLLLGASPAGASGLSDVEGFVDEGQRDKKGVVASNLGSLSVIPSSHPETGTGWGIKGATDKHGRPIVLSQPAASAFMQMMLDSKGQVNASDVASSGRSIKQNDKVGGHENSVHLYGEGLDLSGASHKWMRANGARYGWKYKYSHGPGSGHYDYVGTGAGKTPILSSFGGKAFPFSTTTRTDSSGRPQVGVSGNAADFGSILKNMNLNEMLQESFGRGGGPGSFMGGETMDVFGGLFGGGALPGSNDMFKSGRTKRNASTYEEQARVRRVTEQRNAARREINNRTTEIVQMALAAVESSNGSNRQFISRAEAGIRQLLGAQAGGGTFANVGGTTGTVLRTAVAVLNSFNNPLRGIFQ
tara:strand:+ start:413 stop:3220 length:2808 start_codon:yes stop_codon:yes gene_type:complete